ncbi:hypothetical protein NliqN6_4100 [Naganishia liquefaciens]|uniref:Ribosome biogenesis protein YTM1 n=1 Tax=Naganishia liquefaciens TaxID=104408 RepID=A0A8H3YFW3_9TREE|nr:hypothetical protein NliqN6_4100 [Naganishia liquefaciens]
MSDLNTTTAPAADKVSINLYTRNPAHAIPQSTYLIPADWRRFQLSELINKVINTASGESFTPTPFDFIIEGELLRTTLDNWVQNRRNGDFESVINVEYIQSLLPPKQLESFPQDDWVSGVSIQRPGHILMSSYLSHVKVIPMTQAGTDATADSSVTMNLPSTLGATCCEWLSPNSQSENILVGAGGVDRQAHIFRIPSLVNSSANQTPQEIMTLHLHTGPISSVAPSRSFEHVLTSSWDGLLGVFALPTATNPLEETHDLPAEPKSYLPGQNSKKKRKLAGAAGDAQSGGWRKQPDMVMRGHTARIAGAIWDKEDRNRVWSAAWDGSVRGWEADIGYNSVLKQGPSDKAALCIDQMAQSGTLATGHMDRTVCMWDTREAQSLISLTLATSSPVPSLRAHPTSSFTLATGTYSGNLQIWDIRSPKQALFSVKRQQKEGKGERVLGIDWNGEVLVAGGEDGEVSVWSARGE